MNSSIKMDIEVKKNSLLNINPWLACLASLVIYLLVIVVKHQVLISDDQRLAEFTGEDFEEYKSATNIFLSFKYLILSVIFLGSTFATFLLISASNFFFRYGLLSNQLLTIAVLASSSEIISEVFVVVWFAVTEKFDSSEIFNFDPLSLFGIWNNSEDISFPISYILKSLNLFLVLKIFLLSYTFHSCHLRNSHFSFLLFTLLHFH